MSVPNFCKNCNVRLDDGPGYCEASACRIAWRLSVLGTPEEGASAVTPSPESPPPNPALARHTEFSASLPGDKRREPFIRTRATERALVRPACQLLGIGPGPWVVNPSAEIGPKTIAQGNFQIHRLLATGELDDLVVEEMMVGCDLVLSAVDLKLFDFGQVGDARWTPPQDRLQIKYPLVLAGIQITFRIKNYGTAGYAPKKFSLALQGEWLKRDIARGLY